jgi:hypothetical protein
VTYSCLRVESLEETYPTAGLIQDWHKHRTVNSIRSCPPSRTGCVLNSDRSSYKLFGLALYRTQPLGFICASFSLCARRLLNHLDVVDGLHVAG